MTPLMCHRRWLIIALGLPLYAAALMVVVTFAVALLIDPPEAVGIVAELISDLPGGTLWWAWCGGPVLIVVASQAIFVVPIVQLPLKGRPGGRSMTASLLMVTMIAAGLTVGLFCGVLALVDRWRGLVEDAYHVWAWQVTLPVFAASWIIWSVLLLAFTRRKRSRGLLERLAGLLLAGTVIEVLAVLPIDVMVRRREDCYCATGTFHALLIGVLAAMWLAGPGVVILYARRRRRLGALRCLRCGYHKGPDPSPTCPECGYEWLEA